MKLHELTGEQLLTAMANGELPPPSITQTIPMRLVEVRHGYVDLNVKMVRPVPRHQELFAEGRLLNLSRTIAIAEASLTDAQGKLYAHATCTCSINRG